LLIALLLIALFNAYLMGFHGSAAVVATVIASRALSPRRALALTALAAFGGPLLFGGAVAATVGQALVLPSAWSPEALACGLLAALGWTLLTWWVGLPCSASQALIGGLLGAATIAAGPGAIQPAGALKTFVGLFISPPVGLLAGTLLMRLTLWLAQSATPRANNLFKRLQILTSLGLALTVSANDAQKVMGVMTLILMLTGNLPAFAPPLWVKLLAAGAFGLGILSGGYRLIRTLGGRLFRVRPIHGFVAQLATTAVVLAASQTGLPVSSTQVVSTAIVGVGSAERLSKVRWQVASNMLAAWFLTIPVTATLAGLGVWLWRGWWT
jgi:PiT family inorganic phosphate transporter